MAGYSRLQFVFLLFLLASMCTIQVSMAGGEGSTPRRDCPMTCGYRCNNVKYGSLRELCLEPCNICCDKCQCVPSGMVPGNKEECPCYNNWKTKKGKSYCP